MGEIVRLFAGRTVKGKALPKPRACEECDDPIETARLQAAPRAKRCVACERAHEARRDRILSTARDRDIIIVRGR